MNRRVSTGAMFSMTLCFASTSIPAMTTAPVAPQESIHWFSRASASTPMAPKMNAVSPIRTPPPRPMST
ncbi:MAG: hypothetical protein PVF68_03665 [Acidobacteriota bacterium]